MITDPKAFLRRLLDTALAAADPRKIVAAHLPPRPKGKLLVLGAGKGSGAMAVGAEDHYGDGMTGLVVTRDGYKLPTRHIEVIEARHPVPDQRSVDAAARILSLARAAGPEDLVVCLISGGASALMVAPVDGVSFADKQAINQALLKSGASIDELNCVRKHLSRIKGGRLAQACAPAKVVSLILSDVAGDDMSVIASGPTVADPTTCADALSVVDKYAVSVPDFVRAQLKAGAWESPTALAADVRNVIAGRPRDAFTAVLADLERQGIATIDLGDTLGDEAGVMARAHAERVRRVRDGRDTVKAPCVILSGGEAVVRVTGNGRGGPNTEFALHLARELRGLENVFAISCDTDGTDGKGDHAGALVAPDTLTRAAALGLDPAKAHAANDTAPFFEALGDLVVTGPTYTNVNDFRAILVL